MVARRESLSFGAALRELRRGKKLAREAWPGGRDYVFLATDLELHTAANIGPARAVHVGDCLVKCYRGDDEDNLCVGWSPRQDDMLATDWKVVS